MKRGRLVLLVLGALLAIGAFFGWQFYHSVFGPGPRFAEKQRVLLVPTGASFAQVMDSLLSSGFIEDERLFRTVAARKKYDQRVKPGRYVIASGTSMNDLVNKLRNGEQDPVRVTFTNIKSIPQLAGQLAKYVEADSMAMLLALQDTAIIHKHGFRPEGFISMFIPDTYEFWWTVKPQGLIDRMATEYSRFWTDARSKKAAAHHLSPVEVSTLASIVQAETAKPDEAPNIAGVYLNRLRIGMPLQADPTLKFALGLDSLSRILTGDMRVGSPYNTYTHTGLPPGPINMPEPRYIDAVLNAPDHDYIYFCAREDLSGYSNFARTYDQHLVNARRYQRALNEHGIYR